MRCNLPKTIALSVLLALLIGLLLPAFLSCGGTRRLRSTACARNLSQMHTLMAAYSAAYKGESPRGTGESFWLSLSETTPPLVPHDYPGLFACPRLEEDCPPRKTHYRGPRLPWSQLKPSDPIAADKPGNHGDDEGGCVLLKNGDVLEVGRDDPLWKRCAEVLAP